MAASSFKPSNLRLAEVLASLSLVTDLAARHPAEQALKASALASRIAERMGLSSAESSDAYYTTLLRFVGCTAPMPEYAEAFGDVDAEIRPRGDMTDLTNPREALPFLTGLGQSVPRWRRPAVWASVLVRGRSLSVVGIRADCEVAMRMAERFGLGESVAKSLFQTFERWDGHGQPAGLARDRIAVAARLAGVAFAVVMFHSDGGRDAVTESIRRWTGRILDPEIASAFLMNSDEFLHAAESQDALLDALACEPSPPRLVQGRQLDNVLAGFADFVDLKSTYLHGHSTGVSSIAESAASISGMPAPDVLIVRRAALLHDLGRAAVPTAVWEKPGTFSTSEWERVRLHPYHTERILSRSELLAPLSVIAGMHHERIDGSGYHRGAPAVIQTKPARLLAAADVYHALTEERPHRPALASGAAARVLEGQAGLDPEAIAAVLEAAGQRRARTRTAWPASLTDREVEVLRPLARGKSEREIAEALHVSASTIHTHVGHIYEKAGVATRAAVALFAMEHGLLET